MEIGLSLSHNLEIIMSIKQIDTYQLANESEVPGYIIYKLRSGFTEGVSLEVFFKLARALEVSVEYLLGFSNNYVAVASDEESDLFETRAYKCLKYHDNRYLSWDINQFPLTARISQARRFHSTEAISEFLVNSYYRPEVYNLSPADFEIVDIEVSYKEKAETLEGEI
jgi:transcriptional regulator with XRE-family HTH domain